VYCYSNVALPDSMTGHLMKLADYAREITGLGDAEAAQLIRADGIDILVDLAGHTAGHRLGVFALGPAPVQATYLGYPNTTGLAAVDWRITDIYADPPGDGDEFHTERLARLPRTFLCFQPPAEAPDVQAPPSLKNGHVTFGSFNVLPKVTPEVIRTWSLLLQRVPRSRLLLKALGLGDAGSRAHMLAAFARHGIVPERVTVLPMEGSLQAHLARYHEMDIALDPFPFNGTTTTLEALWMGVPVVAIAGDRHSARVGSGILANAGLGDLAARDANEYIAIAAALAGDGARLAALRLGMRGRLDASPLRDAAGFVRDLEGAYHGMWEQWCVSPGRRLKS
jgi:predicted O-linked N-acetylglucosamine transferase (SPINDLY family)